MAEKCAAGEKAVSGRSTPCHPADRVARKQVTEKLAHPTLLKLLSQAVSGRP
jgi:hypothetical protein